MRRYPLDSSPKEHELKEHYDTICSIVHLLGGAFMWLVVMRAPYDIACLRRRRGHFWRTFALYLPFRYLSTASIMLEMIYACAFPRPAFLPVGKAALVLRLVSFVFAFAIFVLRVNSLWRNASLWVVTSASLLSLVGATAYRLAHLENTYSVDSHVLILSLAIHLSTIIFTFSLIGAFTSCSAAQEDARKSRSSAVTASSSSASRSTTIPSTSTSTSTSVDSESRAWACRRSLLARVVVEVCQGGVISLTVFWLSSVVLSALFIAFKHWDPYTRRLICFTIWLISTHTACIHYDHLAKQNHLFLVPNLPLSLLASPLPVVECDTDPQLKWPSLLSPCRKLNAHEPGNGQEHGEPVPDSENAVDLTDEKVAPEPENTASLGCRSPPLSSDARQPGTDPRSANRQSSIASLARAWP